MIGIKMTAIEFKNVSFIYEGYEAKVLDDINMTVDYGEVALLSGYSGSGKSTLLSLACGIIPNVTPGEVEGDIIIDGESIRNKKLSDITRKVGVVLQNAEAQIIHQTVEDEIAFGCENFAFPPAQIAEEIERTCRQMKLSESWKTRTLSGGQKQRLMTACTLAMKQKILIFDEPLANLDKEGAELLMHTVRTLADSGFAVLIVEHRIDRVIPYVDSIWQIKDGKTFRVNDISEQTEKITDDRTPGEPGKTLIELKNVSFMAGGRTILKNLDLTVWENEKILLLGENGCGKTTLLRLIAGLNRPAQGSIIQYLTASSGTQVRQTKEWFKRIGVVYQNPDYQLFMSTVRDEITFGAKDESFAEKIMEMFGLASLADRHPHSLSEGQKRRVSIAAVVATDPDVILLDEPTVGQDYEGLRDLVRIINDIHEERQNTVITVTHDKRCAEALCGRAVMINDGEVKEAGGKEACARYFEAVSDTNSKNANNVTENERKW